MNQDLYSETIKVCEDFISTIDEQNKKIIIFLDHDPIWHTEIKRALKGENDIKIISNTKDFKAFTHSNGCFKMFVDINMPDKNGIDLAEELALNDYFGDLTLVSLIKPTEKDLIRIEKLGSKFMLKRDVLKSLKIKGVINGYYR